MLLKKYVNKLTTVLFILLWTFMLINVIFNNKVNIFKHNPLIVLLGTTIFIFILYLFYKWLEKLNISIKRQKIVIFVTMLIVFGIQLAFGYFFRVSPSWDLGDIYYGAIGNVDGSNTINNIDYFYRYNNNISITMFLTLIYKICTIFNIYNFNFVSIVVNIFFIDFSIIITYLTAKKIFDNNKALFIFFVMCSMIPLYTYTPIYYTDTFSLPFVILQVFIFVTVDKFKENNRKNIYYILLGIVAFIGMLFKFTSVIVFIAIIIYSFLKNNKKEILKLCIFSFIPIIILYSIQTILISKYFDKDKMKELKYPYTHWIMMGLDGNGGYSGQDFLFTLEHKDIEDKKAFNIEQIKNRIASYCNSGKLLEHIIGKIVYTFGDGTYYATEKLQREPIRNGIYQEFIFYNGKYVAIYSYISQIQHITILILILIAVIKNYEFNSNISNYSFIFYISILGLFVFLQIWETRSRYLVNFIPLFVILSFYGLEVINSFILSRKVRMLNK